MEEELVGMTVVGFRLEPWVLGLKGILSVKLCDQVG